MDFAEDANTKAPRRFLSLWSLLILEHFNALGVVLTLLTISAFEIRTKERRMDYEEDGISVDIEYCPVGCFWNGGQGTNSKRGYHFSHGKLQLHV
jgi:hypothetical protein